MPGKARRPKFDWKLQFRHGEHEVMVGGNTLGASAESQIRGALRENRYAMAEMALLGQGIKIVKKDGEVVFDASKGQNANDIPSWPGTGDEKSVTTAQKLLQYIITEQVPHYLDLFENAFDDYYIEDESEMFWNANGVGGASGEKPTSLSSVAPIESQDDEVI